MFFIVAFHFGCHSGFEFDHNITFNKVFINFLSPLGKIGVDIFVIISGYFLASASFKIERLCKIWFQTWFYSSIIALIFIPFIDKIKLSFIFNFSPFHNNYWFASTYIVLYILFPFINILIKYMTKIQFLTLLFIMTMMWSLSPTFIINSSFCLSNLSSFIYFYLIGSYIYLYDINKITKQLSNYMLLFITSLLIVISIICLNILNNFVDIHFIQSFLSYRYLFSMTSPLSILFSVSIFLCFKNMNIEYNKWINLIAGTTFGIYLIHDNNFVRPFLWKTLFHNADYQNSSDLWIHALWVIPTVFVVCAIIEYLRKQYIEKPLFDRYQQSLIDRFAWISQKTTSGLTRWMDSIK